MQTARSFPRTVALRDTELFRPTKLSSLHEEAVRSFKRAEAVGRAHGVTIEDIVKLGPNFWNMHRDNITTMDPSLFTLLGIHYNLSGGTLCMYMDGRDDIKQYVEDIVNWNVYGMYMLTELGHGLDTSNIETTCTLLPNGSFCLNTPHLMASKYMPTTVPMGKPIRAVVFARLIVKGKDQGIHSFVVDINDGFEMCAGVTSRLLPYRFSEAPYNHCITTFNKVALPSSAILGKIGYNSPLKFLKSIYRVAVGALGIAMMSVPILHVAATIGYRYSVRRKVTGPNGVPHSIIDFRTQEIPIYSALAQAHVFEAYERATVDTFVAEQDPRIQHGYATIFKAITYKLAEAAAINVSIRCGAQGLASYNTFDSMYTGGRAIAIGDGDILVLCIRLATEIILKRYEMPPPRDPSSLLAKHEASLIAHARSMPCIKNHRSAEYNRKVLQRCVPICEAIGARMAYEAAVEAGVHKALLDVFVSSVMKLDEGWYITHAGLDQEAQRDMEDKALSALAPIADTFVTISEDMSFITAPIVSDEKWNEFVMKLPTFEKGTRDEDLPTSVSNGILISAEAEETSSVTDDLTQSDSSSSSDSESDSAAFESAATFLANSTAKGVSNKIKLEMYGLYKYVTVASEPTTPAPEMFNYRAAAKWDAWKEIGAEYGEGHQAKAKVRYVTLARQIGWTEDGESDSGREELPESRGHGHGFLSDIFKTNGLYLQIPVYFVALLTCVYLSYLRV